MDGKDQKILIQSVGPSQIKHIYRDFVFIFCRILTENSTLFVSEATNLLLADGQLKVSSNSSSSTSSSSLHLNSPIIFIAIQVKISQEPYKGYVGIVKDATVSTCRTELHTKCQTITIDRNIILSTMFVTPQHDGSMTQHAHGGASAWDPAYTTTPRVDYDDDNGPSTFAIFSSTTPSSSYLTDKLSSGLEKSSNTRGLSSISNSSSTITSDSGSIRDSTDSSASVALNVSIDTYAA
ncbi:unnamed protein product [Rotaria sp. Silwood2]|nr:unnamed protein product [Rotaria sp. Silwood2]CAF3940517.1 unnamed protein product [Rotaria sp. Silwood2]